MNRPTGVTLIAVLYFLGAAFCVIGGIGVMAGAGFIGGLIGSAGQGSGGVGAFFAGLGIVTGVILLIFGAIDFAVGWGLVKLNGVARIVAIIFSAISALFQVLGLLGSLASFKPSNFLVTL